MSKPNHPTDHANLAAEDRKHKKDGKDIRFVLIKPTKEPSFKKITSVAVVPFTEDGKIVIALLDRGPDLPGGHINSNETTIEQTARRETLEEVGATLQQLTIAKVIEVQDDETPPEDYNYMVIMTGLIDTLSEIPSGYESHGRLILSRDEFISRYTGYNTELMRTIVDAAYKLVFKKE